MTAIQAILPLVIATIIVATVAAIPVAVVYLGLFVVD